MIHRVRMCLLLVVLLLGFAREVYAADSTLIPFAMEDQFKNKYTDSAFQNTTLLVLVANKGGSQYSRKWSPALRDSLSAWGLGDEVKLLGVADMKGVPFFIKGLVKGKLPKDPKDWMLVDWKGVFAKAYECTGDTCNVLIFDSGSVLRHRLLLGAVAPTEMDDLRKLLFDVTGRENPGAALDPSSVVPPR